MEKIKNIRKYKKKFLPTKKNSKSSGSTNDKATIKVKQRKEGHL